MGVFQRFLDGLLLTLVLWLHSCVVIIGRQLHWHFTSVSCSSQAVLPSMLDAVGCLQGACMC